MKASGATESDQCEIARVASALNRHHPNCLFHGGIHYAKHSGGKLLQREPAPVLLQPFPGDAASAVEIESEIAAEKTRWLQAA